MENSIPGIDIETWYDPKSDVVLIKFRKSPEQRRMESNSKEHKCKQGCLVGISRELIESNMKDVPEGCEYPFATMHRSSSHSAMLGAGQKAHIDLAKALGANRVK